MKKIKLAVFDMEGTLFKRSYCFGFIKESFPQFWRNLCLCQIEESLTTRPFSKSWTLLCQLLGPQACKINKESWEQWCDGGYFDKFKKTLALLKKGEIKEWTPWSYLSDLLGPEACKINEEAWVNWFKGDYLAQSGEGIASRKFTSAWTLLCDLLGPYASKENKENWDRWSDRGYPGYSEWVIDTIKIHKKYGLTKGIFDAVVTESAEYFPGVAETFQALQSQGITIALVSGGLKAMSDRVAMEYKLEHCFTSAEYFWNSDDTITHWNCQPSDFIHKKRLVKLLLHDLGISKEQAVFIGDGGNDRDVAQYVGFSIGFNPKPYHEFFWDTFVQQEDLRSVLGTLGISAKSFGGNSRLPKTGDSESDRVTKSAFRKFLVEHGGLTEYSSRSYITYLNSICKNMTAPEADSTTLQNTPLQILCSTARLAKSQKAFLKTIAKPLTGPKGREGDLVSVAKQLYNHISGDK